MKSGLQLDALQALESLKNQVLGGEFGEDDDFDVTLFDRAIQDMLGELELADEIVADKAADAG